ncbi:MAG: helix-turn-helix domain-containing protein [Thermoplasmatota archaeon]
MADDEPLQCGDMLCLLFDLTQRDMDVYRHLLQQEQRAEDIAAAMHKDRSTIHRSLRRLVDGGFCTRERRLVDGGGRYFVYRAVPPDQVKEHVRSCIEGWYERMHRTLDHFTEEFDVG